MNGVTRKPFADLMRDLHGLQVAALVREGLRSRLIDAVGTLMNVRCSDNWDDLLELIRTKPVDVAVIDPSADGQTRADLVERLATLFPSLPILLYTSMTPALAPNLLGWGLRGIHDVVFSHVDDQPPKLAQGLFSAASRSSRARLYDILFQILGDAPRSLIDALIDSLVGAIPRDEARDPATALGFPTGGDESAFLGRLPGASVLILCVRTLYARLLLQDPGYTVEDVSRKVRYESVLDLVSDTTQIFGSSPGDLRVASTITAAVHAVDRRLRSS